ncbi:Cullin-1 [Diplonema papillatum]|nr:Cullin-1 [Diplonema papillatum]
MQHGSGPNGEKQSKLEKGCHTLQKAFEEKVVAAVESGYRRPFTGADHMAMYTVVYDLCTECNLNNAINKAPDVLYSTYAEMVTKYLKERRIESTGMSADKLLRLVVQRWENHKMIVKTTVKVFGYLDRFHTKHTALDTTTDKGLKCFLTEIYSAVKVDLRGAIFEHIQREREGEVVERGLLRQAIGVFIDMGIGDDCYETKVYNVDFEAPFLTFTGNYYEREAKRWMAENSTTEYMKKAEQRLNEELQRAEAYLHRNSEKPLIRVVEQKLLETLLNLEETGFIALLQDNRLDDIARAYRLFSRIAKGVPPISRLMYEYVTSEGKQIVQKHSSSPELCYKAYTKDLLDIHQKYRSILKNQLNDDPIFAKSIKDAFEAFVNQPVQSHVKGAPPGTPTIKVSCSELISNYCDMLMKNAASKMDDDELENVLEQVVAIFGYINDKDHFQEFYRKQLSKRLLVSVVNDDCERSLISKLKMRQGAPYTSRLEGMLKDKNLSADWQAKFRNHLAAKKMTFGFDATMQVLTTGCWPSFQIFPLNVPAQAKAAIDEFATFYDSETQSRKLNWVHSLGTVTIEGVFNRQKFQLQMTTFQACVLLLFNHKDEYTGDELMKKLNLPWDEVKKALQSLAMGKYRILLKEVPESSKISKSVDGGDTFKINNEFTDKSRKLKIPTVVAKANLKHAQQVQQSVEDDRRHAIEACLVRIMKSRKLIEHPILVGECAAQLSNHFIADPRHIKRRIEELIAREYIERDADKPSLYRYLA